MNCGILCALADAIWPPFILSTLIGVPSVLLYLLELCTLIRHWKSFNSSFFFLFLMRAVPVMVNFWYLSDVIPAFNQLLCLILLLAFWPIGHLHGLDGIHVAAASEAALLLRILSLPRWESGKFLFAPQSAYFCAVSVKLWKGGQILFKLCKLIKIWRLAIPAAVLITFLSPLSITVYIFQLDIFMSYDEQNRTFTLNYTRPDDYKVCQDFMAENIVFSNGLWFGAKAMCFWRWFRPSPSLSFAFFWIS